MDTEQKINAIANGWTTDSYVPCASSLPFLTACVCLSLFLLLKKSFNPKSQDVVKTCLVFLNFSDGSNDVYRRSIARITCTVLGNCNCRTQYYAVLFPPVPCAIISSDFVRKSFLCERYTAHAIKDISRHTHSLRRDTRQTHFYHIFGSCFAAHLTIIVAPPGHFHVKKPTQTCKRCANITWLTN